MNKMHINPGIIPINGEDARVFLQEYGMCAAFFLHFVLILKRADIIIGSITDQTAVPSGKKKDSA